MWDNITPEIREKMRQDFAEMKRIRETREILKYKTDKKNKKCCVCKEKLKEGSVPRYKMYVRKMPSGEVKVYKFYCKKCYENPKAICPICNNKNYIKKMKAFKWGEHTRYKCLTCLKEVDKKKKARKNNKTCRRCGFYGSVELFDLTKRSWQGNHICKRCVKEVAELPVKCLKCDKQFKGTEIIRIKVGNFQRVFCTECYKKYKPREGSNVTLVQS